jgi:hypothetical protein
MRRLLFDVLSTACLLSGFIVDQAEGRSVAASLSAPWPTLPSSPVLEAAEFLAERGNDSFWKFMNEVASPSFPLHFENQQEVRKNLKLINVLGLEWKREGGLMVFLP